MAANDGRCAHPTGGTLALLLLLAQPAPCAPPDAAPHEVIATAADAFATLVASRRADLERDLEGDYALIDEYLLPYFDLETSCRLILREHWNAASAEQRRRFARAFPRWLLAGHGHALLSFRHDTITVVRPDGDSFGGSARVRARLRLSNGSTFDLDFYLRRDPGGWRIVDVIAEGISYVRTFRSDFGLEIRATSLEALTERLERESEPASSR